MRDGDKKHLAEVYIKCAPGVHRQAMKLLRDKEEALDATQDAFLEYMKMYARGTLRGEASPFTLLYQIVTRRALDRLRRRSPGYGLLDELQQRDDDAPGSATARILVDDGGMPRIEALMDLATLTQDEPDEVVAAAAHYLVDGLSYEEVGKELGISRKKASALLEQFNERVRQRSAQLKRKARS
jgi:RNA polymerase sigma-70 factor (ECF subfamily)